MKSLCVSGGMVGRVSPAEPRVAPLWRVGDAMLLVDAFSPLSLFAGGEVGAWYDPSDFASMFQDSYGTTPVTAVEQPVGLILDKRLGTPGQNLFPDPGWTTLGGWEAVANATLAVNAGKLVITAIGTGTNPTAGYRLTTVVGKQYQFIVTLVADAMDGNTFIGAGPGGGDGWSASFGSVNAGSTPGTYAIIFVATTTDTRLTLFGGSAANAAETLQFSTPVIRELPGNHATQPTAAARPVVSARKNWFTSTEDFTDAAWAASSVTKTASTLTFTSSGGYIQCGFPPIQGIVAGATLTLSITMSADTPQPIQLAIADNADGDPFYVLSINLTTTPTRFTFTQTMGAAFSGNLAVLIRGLGAIAAGTIVTVSEPQLEIGSTATAYQRVTTASDYDTVGFPHYLLTDGIDDRLDLSSLSLIAGMDCFVAVNTNTDIPTQALFALDDGYSAFFGVWANGGGSATYGGAVGTPDLAVDGTLLPAATRNDLFSALTVGDWHIIEYRNLDLSAWTTMRLFGGGLPLLGGIGGLVLCPSQDAATRTKVRQYLGNKVGLSL